MERLEILALPHRQAGFVRPGGLFFPRLHHRRTRVCAGAFSHLDIILPLYRMGYAGLKCASEVKVISQVQIQMGSR